MIQWENEKRKKKKFDAKINKRMKKRRAQLNFSSVNFHLVLCISFSAPLTYGCKQWEWDRDSDTSVNVYINVKRDFVLRACVRYRLHLLDTQLRLLTMHFRWSNEYSWVSDAHTNFTANFVKFFFSLCFVSYNVMLVLLFLLLLLFNEMVPLQLISISHLIVKW